MELTPAEVKRQLEGLLVRPEWTQSVRMAQFLRFVVECSLAGQGSTLKESVVGVAVFGRDPGYDPKTDPVVRVEARRLRQKLAEYYAGPGAADPIRFVLPKGTYQPQFERLALPEPPVKSRRGPVVAVAGAAVLALLAGGTFWRYGGSDGGPHSPGTPRVVTSQSGFSRSPAFSPDGPFLAYSHDGVSRSTICVRPVGGGAERLLTPGEHSDFEPVWSPDGRWIAFLRQQERGRLLILVVSTGAPPEERRVAEVAARGAIDWTADGKGILAGDRDDASSPLAIFHIDVQDGRKRQLTTPPRGTHGDTHPRVSPDGQRFVFSRAVESSAQDLYVASMSGGEPRRATFENRVVEGVCWTPRGQLIASLQRGAEQRSLWRVDVDRGRLERIPEAGVGPISPALSRAGDRLAYVSRLSDTNLWGVRPGAKGTATGTAEARQVTDAVALDTSPRLTADGQRLAWRSARSGVNEVWVGRPNGAESRQLTAMNGPTTGSPAWSPDGTWVAFDSRPKERGQIFVIPSGGGAAKALTDAAANAVLPSYSRDGKWIYFSTDRGGMWEVWKMRGDGAEAQRVAGRGAFNATESWDGKWLYFVKRGEGGVWRMPVGGGGPEKVTEKKVTEEKVTEAPGPNMWGQWAISASGLFFVSEQDRVLRRMDLATRALRDVIGLTKMPVTFDSGMTVSAGEEWLVWSRLDQARSDVFVVEGFR